MKHQKYNIFQGRNGIKEVIYEELGSSEVDVIDQDFFIVPAIYDKHTYFIFRRDGKEIKVEILPNNRIYANSILSAHERNYIINMEKIKEHGYTYMF